MSRENFLNKAEGPFHVAVVGATGLVGEHMLRVLDTRRFPIAKLSAVASRGGRNVAFGQQSLPVHGLDDFDFSDVDFALFSAGSGPSKQHAVRAANAGAVVIDNSSAWRRTPDVPLCVPEVNGESLAHRPKGIIANPNCSTMQLVVALAPIHRRFALEQVVVSTYQAVSGAGRSALERLDVSHAKLRQGESDGLAGNVWVDWSMMEGTGYTEEEDKMVYETRRILGSETMQVSPTTVRVPVAVGHSEAVWLRAKQPLSAGAVRELLRNAPGIQLCDDIPTPQRAAGADPVFVGRIRDDHSAPGACFLWVVADNMLKGAALNAVQIAERLVSDARPV